MQQEADVIQDLDGNAIAGAAVTVIDKITGELAALFADNETTSISNPVYTDANGRYAYKAKNGKYRTSVSIGGRVFPGKADITLFDPADGGADSIGFIQTGAAAVPRSVEDELRERVSVTQFGAVGDGVSNDTAAFAAAGAAARLIGVALRIPSGIFIIDGWAIPAGLQIIGAGRGATVLKRRPGSSILNTISATNISGFSICGVTIDGDRDNQTGGGNNLVISGCWSFTLSDIASKNARAASGNGNGVVILSTIDAANGTRSLVEKIYTNNCAGAGVLFRTGGKRVTFKDINTWGNGGSGFSIDGRVFPPTPDVFQQIEVDGVNAWNNGSSGFAVGGYAVGGTMSVPVYGSGADPCSQSTFRNITAYENAGYGIVLQVTDCMARNLYGYKNGGTGTTYAGLLANSTRTRFSGMLCDENEFYGIDCGGSIDCTFEDFQCRRNGVNSVSGSGSGFNYGGSIGLRGMNGYCAQNGGASGGIQFFCMRQEGAGNGYGFMYDAARCSLKDCTAEIGASNMVGFRHSEDPADCEWVDCRVTGAGANDINSFQNESLTSRVINCQHGTGNSITWPYYGNGFLSASTLFVADNLEGIVLNAGASPITMQAIYSHSMNRLIGRVTKIVLNTTGAGYTSAPIVTISGGGGTGAAAVALLKGDGTLSGVHVTSGGSGYTSTPTVTLAGGGGTVQATATASTGCININGRKLDFLFGSGGPITVAHGGLAGGLIRLTGGVNWTTGLNDNLSLRAWTGTWRETSRLDN